MTDWLARPIEYWRSGGPLLVPLVAVSFGIWAYFVRTRDRLIEIIRRSGAVEKLLCRPGTSKDISELYRETARIPGAVAWIARTALWDGTGGTPLAQAFDTREAQVLGIVKRDLVVLAALTAIAPLLGLLGTVMGMIETFDAVSATGVETGVRVASGISRALVTTQFGLVVALPGVFGMAHLLRLLRQVQVRLAECRTHMVPLIERSIGRPSE